MLSLIKRKFNLKSDAGQFIRFFDANNLTIITKSDYLIYKRPERMIKDPVVRTFIIQVGLQDLIKLECLGI